MPCLPAIFSVKSSVKRQLPGISRRSGSRSGKSTPKFNDLVIGQRKDDVVCLPPVKTGKGSAAWRNGKSLTPTFGAMDFDGKSFLEDAGRDAAESAASFSEVTTRTPSPELGLPNSNVTTRTPSPEPGLPDSNVTTRTTSPEPVEPDGNIEPAQCHVGQIREATWSNPDLTEKIDFKESGIEQTQTALPGSIQNLHQSHSDRKKLQCLAKASGPLLPVVPSHREQPERAKPSPRLLQSRPPNESNTCPRFTDTVDEPAVNHLEKTVKTLNEAIKDDPEEEEEEENKSILAIADAILAAEEEEADEKTVENANKKEQSSFEIHKYECDFHDDWHLDDMFAEGTFSTVYYGRRKDVSPSPTSNTVAVVKVSQPGKESELLKEAKILQHIGCHPLIVECMGLYHDERYGAALVLELLGGGEVLQLVDSPCSEMHVRVVSLQVCQALGFVHSRGIVHRDVKAENIVFSGKGVEVKLIDFGLAGFEADDEEMMKRCGSPGYIAPEVIGGERCSFVADIFGLGVVTYLLIAGQLPFPGKTMEDILKKNMRCQVRFEDDIWFGLEEARSFVMSLLAKDVNSRPAAGEVWRHPWLACLLTEG